MAHHGVSGRQSSAVVSALGFIFVAALAGCAPEAGPSATPSGSSPSVPAVGQAFSIVGRPTPDPAQPLPLPPERSTYARWAEGGIMVGAAGSGSCYPVPYAATVAGPRHLRVDFVDPARRVSDATAVSLAPDTVCTMDYLIKSYLVSGLGLSRGAPVTVDLVVHRGSAGGDITETSTI